MFILRSDLSKYNRGRPSSYCLTSCQTCITFLNTLQFGMHETPPTKREITVRLHNVHAVYRDVCVVSVAIGMTSQTIFFSSVASQVMRFKRRDGEFRRSPYRLWRYFKPYKYVYMKEICMESWYQLRLRQTCNFTKSTSAMTTHKKTTQLHVIYDVTKSEQQCKLGEQ